jgi:anhydro-N-acetylmuramic acid kinase
MPENKVYTAIGLMSGTSLDAVDAALIETDGAGFVRPLGFVSLPYEEAVRAEIRSCYGIKDRNDSKVRVAEDIVAREHIKGVRALLKATGREAKDIDVIGFHGQTIYHAPKDGVTHQIGNADMLAAECAIDVVADFRVADVKAGGEGAPLAPIYHWARIHSANREFPVVVLNIGGVSNATWLGEGANEIMAFDCGPGNALMDDWAQRHTGARYDEDGKLAASGHANDALVEEWLGHEYFKRPAPKSMDRDQWDIAGLGKLSVELTTLSPEDGAATFLKFTVEAIVKGVELMPSTPKHWYACGGGRHNKALMKHLSKRLKDCGYGALHSVDDLGWDGDATEAECFAYLAVRSLKGEPISFPTTTNAPKPMTGGNIFKR